MITIRHFVTLVGTILDTVAVVLWFQIKYFEGITCRIIKIRDLQNVCVSNIWYIFLFEALT